MHAKKLVSKRQKMAFDYLVKLKGSYYIQGSQKPMDSGDYISRIIGGGVDQWVFASNPVPDVDDADCLTFAGKLDKTKKGKSAVTLGSLVEISLDGEVVWAAKPVQSRQEDEESSEETSESPAPAKQVVGNGKSAAPQSAAASDHAQGRAAARA